MSPILASKEPVAEKVSFLCSRVLKEVGNKHGVSFMFMVSGMFGGRVPSLASKVSKCNGRHLQEGRGKKRGTLFIRCIRAVIH